ncbi:hypothetical protein BU17DRAFT_71529 [Hysterangium stoloniferum]|nr:hypothetical protein BU17DRAFT_71529 [Hysterangium stoloniferum]
MISPLNVAHRGSPFRTAPVHYHAPPLVNASLAFSVIFIVAALIQLGFITFSVVRTKPFRLIAPVIATAAALIVSIVGYALNVTSIVVLYTDNRFGFARITALGWIRLQVATTLFEEWPEFLLLAAVVFFLRHRYLAYSDRYVAARRAHTIPILALLGLFTIFLVFFPIIFNVLWVKLETTLFFSFRALRHAENVYLDVYYVYVGSYILASIFVCILCFIVKKTTSPDPILKILFNVVVPLLALRATARIVFAIVNAIAPEDTNGLAITFFNWLILYGIYLATTAVLVFCLVRPKLWTGARENIMLKDTRLHEAAASDANFDAHWPQRFTSEPVSDVKPLPSPH